MVISLSDSRDRIRIARFPIDSKLGSSTPPGMSPVGVTTSLDFDGTTSEHLANTSNNLLGIANSWTINIWWKKTSAFPANHLDEHIVEAAGNENRITHEIHNSFNNRANWIIYMSDGSNYKRAQDNDYWQSQTNLWVMTTLRWGGSTDLTLMRNATQVSLDGSDGSGGTQTDTARQMQRLFQRFPGRVHSLAFFSAKLDNTNVTAIYNSGNGTDFDLQTDSGGYDKSANLAHWYVFGANTTTDNSMGDDYGFASTLINVMDNAVGMTTADLVADSPT